MAVCIEEIPTNIKKGNITNNEIGVDIFSQSKKNITTARIPK